MNQAQQSAKWNPRDSMNFREQGASQKDKSHSETYSNKLSILLQGAGEKVAGFFSRCKQRLSQCCGYTGVAQPWVACGR